MNSTKIQQWWAIDKNKLLGKLQVDPIEGLTEQSIQDNKENFGTNEIEEIKPTKPWKLIFESLKEPMILLLLGISFLSLSFGKITEAVFMVFVVIAYIFVEFINKFRTDKTMSKLRELTQPEAKVIRDKKIQIIKTSNVVVGDIVILSEGVRIPADLRLIDSFGLVVNESSLTGESFPIQKDAQATVYETAPLAERKNSVFSGTVVLSGEGKGVVTAVGKESALGTISTAVLAQKKEKTFVQKAMLKLVKILVIIAILVSIIIPLIGFLRGLNGKEMILTWLALTFLMVPGQPPIIITMALALASFDLAKKKLIVKRLKGVEVLGQITAILTDKTGTITENKMQVTYFLTPDGKTITYDQISAGLKQNINLCLPEYSNDPTDRAVKKTLNQTKKEQNYNQIYSFSDNHPWRTLYYQNENSFGALAGEPEKLIGLSGLTDQAKDRLLTLLAKETAKGNRVVGYALRQGAEENLNAQVELLALAVLVDPVREGAKDAIQSLKKAHISTYMVTGDHASTASEIAKQIDLNGQFLTGPDIERMSDTGLKNKLQTVRVFARVSPSDKQKLVGLIRQNGETVAVIGDGVNDAPAIKAADMGIAMGEIGTDLAKEAADLILTDDNFVHLPDAVAIGRKSLDNFRKGLTYYLSAKAILLFTFLVPLGLGIPFPFDPIHIIFIELLMDLASSTIFVTEMAEPNLMTSGPRKISDFLNLKMVWKILRNGAPLAFGILSIYLWVYYTTSNIVLAQTTAFVAWLMGHILLALNLKQDKISLFKQGITSNRFGLFWLIGMVLMSIIITMIPPFYSYLHTTALSLKIWVVALAVVLGTTFWIEIAKILRRA